MANPEHLEAARGGASSWNQWRATSEDANPDLSGADLSGTSLDGASLHNTVLRKAIIREARSASFQGAMLQEARLEHGQLARSNFDSASLQAANLARATLDRTSFNGADLRRADFAGAILWDAQFRGANLEGANLLDADVNAGTNFENAHVKGTTIARYTLERLDNYGHLTLGQRMTMNIVDPVATMRSYYSGIWQWIHMIALMVFIAPYVLFLGRQYAIARFVPMAEPSVTILEALWRYIQTGGTMIGGIAWWPFGAFCFSISYNVLRALLLFKTKQLELQQEVRGVPVVFSLVGFWRWALRLANWMFLINIFVVAYHTLHFLQMRVPRRW